MTLKEQTEGEGMNKKKLIARAAEVLRQNNVRKSVPKQRSVLHISDDEGNHSNFTIRKPGRGVLFNADDVEAVLDACLAVVEDTLKHGEEIYIHGYGTIDLHYRAPKRVRIPATGEWADVNARFLPHFSMGKNLKMAAKVYEMSVAGKEAMMEREASGEPAEEETDGD